MTRSEAVIAANAYSIDIPEARRGDTAQVFRLAADRLHAMAVNDYWTEADVEITLAVVSGRYQVLNNTPPQPWILPLFRDVMGLSPREIDVWDAWTPLCGAAFVLRAFAHAIENGDL